jgi:acetolactate synthase-1/2/3 large subunit
MTSSVTGAQATVESLAREGIHYVFGLPGTTIMDLIDALGEREDIRYIAARHEQVAAFMADGYARGSGKVGVCMASRGPGAANLAIGVHNAHAESIPVVALVGQVPDTIAERDSFEEMDLLTFFKPVTKWGVEIHEADRIPELLQRAIRTAKSGRPGAVLVSLPHNLQTSTLPSPVYQRQWRVAPSAPASADVERAAEILAAATKPVIIVGGGVPSHDPAVRALAERLSAPVVTTWLRNGVYSHASESYLGCLGYGAVAATNSAVSDADVIVALGCKMSEFSTQRWSLVPKTATLIHVDVDEHVLGRVYIPEVGMLADAATTASLIDSRLAARNADSSSDVEAAATAARIDRLAELRAAYLSQTVVPPIPPTQRGVSSAAVLAAVQTVVDEPDTVLISDSAGFGTWIHRYMRFDRPNTFYGAAGGSLGWGFPASMGIKLARPDSAVICVVGDGGFWMVAQDVETAVRENIAITIVVVNNFAFGNTRDRQKVSFGERYNGVFYGNPDFAEFARMLGAYGERVETDDELAPALKRARDSGRFAIVDVIQDRMEGLPPDLAPPGAR